MTLLYTVELIKLYVLIINIKLYILIINNNLEIYKPIKVTKTWFDWTEETTKPKLNRVIYSLTKTLTLSRWHQSKTFNMNVIGIVMEFSVRL